MFQGRRGSDSTINHVSRVDRQQTLLLPETIEGYVAWENPVRFIDAFVASLDLSAYLSITCCTQTGSLNLSTPIVPEDLTRFGVVARC